MTQVRRVLAGVLLGLTGALLWGPGSPAQADGVDATCVAGCETGLQVCLNKGVSSRKQCYMARYSCRTRCGVPDCFLGCANDGQVCLKKCKDASCAKQCNDAQIGCNHQCNKDLGSEVASHDGW